MNTSKKLHLPAKVGVLKFGGSNFKLSKNDPSKPQTWIAVFALWANWIERAQESFDILYIVFSAPAGITKKIREIYRHNGEDLGVMVNHLISFFEIIFESLFFDNMYVDKEKLKEEWGEVKSDFFKKLTDKRLSEDEVAGIGEVIFAFIVRSYFNKYHYLDPLKFINVRDGGKVCMKRTREDFDGMIKEPVNLCAGFIAWHKDNKRMTDLSDNGSDITAVTLAVLSGADEIIFFKDVDGVYDYSEAAGGHVVPHLDYLGFQGIGEREKDEYETFIVHDSVPDLINRARIPTRFKNYYEPGKSGTIVCDNDQLLDLVAF